MDGGPVFIGGLDRSGKTLLRLALSVHPNLLMTRRTYMWPRYYKRFGNLSQPENFERCLAAMLSQKSICILKPVPERIRREFWQMEPTYARLFALFHEHFAEQMGKPRWGEQAGLIERYADPIMDAYPSARIIHMIRDPRNRFEEILLSSPPVFRPGKAGSMTAGWLYSVNLAKRNLEHYPDRYKIVFYESLLSHPEETLRNVCTFLGEEFIPAMLTLEGAVRLGNTGESEADEKTEWETGIVDFNLNERRKLSRREVVFIQNSTSHMMRAYGYLPSAIKFSLLETLQYTLDWPFNLMRMLAWRTLEAERLA